MRADRYYPGFHRNLKWYPDDLVLPGMPLDGGNVWYVDGDKSSNGGGGSWEDAFSESQFNGNLSSISSAIAAGDVFYVAGRTMAATDTDPISYTTNLVLNVPQVSLIGVSRGRTQGGLPQLKVGATTTSPIIEIKAPGVLIQNIGINGAGGTGGGIKLTDDGGTTSAAFGWSVLGCHFKNCVGTTATNALTGGAVWIGSAGGAWQGLLAGNRFYKNVGDFVLPASANTIPQDIVIEDNVFSEPAASVDCNIFVGSGGINGLEIHNNRFPCNPNITSGSNASFLVLTSCVGLLSDNKFAAQTAEGVTTEIKFGATQENLVQTTMFMAHNYGEFPTGVGGGLISGEIFRT